MNTTLGFLMMLAIIGLILVRRISPVVAFTTLPVAVCLLAGFDLGQIGEFIKAGLITVAPTAALFLFAILFFGIMRDRGLFDPLVNLLIRSTGGKPLAVALVTVLVKCAPCGSSSSEVLRSTRPTRVTRASSLRAWTTLLPSSVTVIERNLYT